MESIQQYIPTKYVPYVMMGVVAWGWLGRGITAIRNGGGIIEIYRSIIYGSTTIHNPTPAPGTTAQSATKLGLIAILLGLAIPGAWTGCANQSIPAVAYKAEQGTSITVNAAMTAWGVYVQAQQQAGTPVPVATELKVQGLFVKYQAAMLTLIDATRLANQLTTTNSVGSATANASITTASANLQQTISDLTTLISSLGVKF